MPEFLIAWDRWLFLAVSQGHRTALLDGLMLALGAKTYVIVPGVVAAVALLVWGGTRGRWAVPAALLAVLMADQAAALMKLLVARPRPCHAFPDLLFLDACTRSFAFPSSHAANMFALAAALGYTYKKWAWGLMVLAGAVAYSRVYVGAHYPGDVVGGAILGVALGVLAQAATGLARTALRRAGLLSPPPAQEQAGKTWPSQDPRSP